MGPYTDTAGRRNAQRAAFLARIRQGRVLMGIVNVTPDSFSDGGRFVTRDAACAQALAHVGDGASIVDIGAESTRPGYTPVAADEEWARLADILPAVIDAVDIAVSIDTMKACVAERALAQGLLLLDDSSAHVVSSSFRAWAAPDGIGTGSARWC